MRRAALATAAALLVNAAPAAGPPVGPEAPPPGAVADPVSRGFVVRRAGHAGMGLSTGTFVTGLSVKVMATRQHAIQLTAGLGWGPFTYWPRAGLGLGLDYLFHQPTLFDAAPVSFGWHVGVGASVRVRPEPGATSVAAGVHAILGAELLFRDAPVDVSLAWRPGALAGTGRARGVSFAYGDVGLDVRFWFDARALGDLELP